ncbi:hypothetical protein PFISCL1PPCAC_2735 [Pristionchus fissidentatus]|uniref:Uncharacterized protein n=1 Tax=Pristionchus fissidentatus TaxID=1538716 RepID=A0AAV5UVZ0_9BILA|nr:hypothetical protein PFISCL1PPCAC_2729 [Pristionchus fissidentatus]GMT11435.1 hypothetical protein PFISCL1PPCAC_2732 [Pristionchus fissidentatus]GMT11438.1 hypothetical protein PFISCL1PPCAC_2735 [Pristionchus fissidentatus]
MRVLLLLCCLIGVSLSIAQHAITSIRLNKSLFQLASNQAKSIIDKLVPDLPIPPINITTDGGVKFYTRWINLTEFDFPRTTFTISPDGLNWNTTGGKIQIAMHFVARYTAPLNVSFTKTGYATVTVDDLRTNINAIIKTHNTRPVLITNNCAVSVEKIEAVIDANITGIILSLIKGIVLDYVRLLIKENACTLISTLTEKANAFVRAQPEEIRVWRNIYLNYTAYKDPVFHDDYIEAECAFRVAVHENSSLPGLLDMEDNVTDALMTSMWIEEEMTSFQAKPSSNVLHVMKDVILYVLSCYGVLCAVFSLVRWFRKRSIKMNSQRIFTTFENEALNTK